MMQATGIPTQEADGAGVVMATEIIADLKKERDDLQENLDICAGLADRYMYRQRIIECTLKLKNERLLRLCLCIHEKIKRGGRMMKKCTLTQVPCRKAIAEVVKANKNKKSLQLTYEVAKLFQIVMTDENSTLSKEDWKRYFIITKLFMISDLRHLECIDSFTNGLMGS